MLSLAQLEGFMRLLHAAQRVKRVARLPGETEQRNTAEHTFELALFAWYIATTEKLDLDIEKVIKYALAHDLIEGYAGDTFIYDSEAQKTKADREAQALARIEKEFPEFPELAYLIHEYEKKETKESKFVYALDKLIDPLNTSMDDERSLWKDFNISYADVRAYKDPKIAQSPFVQGYWDMLCQKLDARKDFFFHE